jgi:hypothetical protein
MVLVRWAHHIRLQEVPADENERASTRVAVGTLIEEEA